MVRGEVILHGNHADVSISQGPFVSVFTFVYVGEIASHPIVGTTSWRLSFFKGICPMSCSLATNAQAFEVLGRGDWDVDIQAGALGGAVREDLLGHCAYHLS